MSVHVSVQVQLHAPYQKAWKQLWRKTYQTRDFINGLTQLTIHEHTDNHVLRTMAMGGHIIKEYITRDQSQGLVTFHNIEGSNFVGDIFNKLEKRDDKLYLIFSANTKNLKGQNIPNEQMFKVAVMNTKKVIES